ncbi:FMN-binding negative transcriptional regulator [Actinomadura sp. ATCC 31491]|uniref:FMN-binding negative transcriptional regulator n=1 Tax=Actinomadura luzonensis TaxID=2805427 RepID=A0ABT0FW23_9ACTN|nr:FMN-binding negative transcriptional regulator [Actinomadura luzonensis]MCK2216180.1 FMN-binding negative transcriptional regulator [Actinomadura luzonensis]UKU09931.1 Luz13 [Actinomadura luzonensis]
MFVPGPYRQPAGGWTAELVRGNPLALLATNGPADAGPYATHVPVIPDPAGPEPWAADLSGAVLLGHMNRANPHWKALEPGGPALVTFTGPHAYVSPAVYRVSPAAPTWNFTSVHVHGTLSPIRGEAETLEVVCATVRAFEAAFGTGWDMTDSLGYFRRILPGVGAFRIAVTRAEGMFKLSQEQRPEIRERVRASFAARPSCGARQVAELMGRLAGEPVPPPRDPATVQEGPGRRAS